MARLAFLGTPEVAAVALQALIEAGHEIPLVVTEPDRRRGRGTALTPTPVKALALSAGIGVSESVEDVLESGAELGVVVAFGRLVRPPVLERLGFVNVHFSLLPRWRGAAPVERAILAGDEETGVAIMRLEEGLDTGPVYATRRLEIPPHEHADALRLRLAEAGAELLVECLAGGIDGLGRPEPQEGEASYARKLSPEELEIDWALPAESVERLVRLDRAFTTWRGERLIVRDGRARPALEGAEEGPHPPPGSLEQGRVVCGESWFELLEVQPAGRGRLDARAWWLGARPQAGERLGPPQGALATPPPG